GAGAAEEARGAEVLDAGGRLLIPGLIDLHVHGAGGGDAMDGTAEAITTVARTLARLGTTSFLATSFLHPEGGDAHLPVIAEAVGKDVGGARVLGQHLEGPFISPARRGGIPAAALRPSSPELLGTLLERAGGTLRMMTVAPELPGAMALLPAMEAAGVVASFGHSDASYDEARSAFDAGIRHVTHLYNAMPSLHHRDPGPLPAIFETPGVVVQLISDGAHVAPPVLRWTAATLGAGRCACITDGLRSSGLADGRYDYGGRPFEARDGIARYPDGTLVGTTLGLLGVVRRFAEYTGLPFATAVDTASRVPARVLGLEHRKGRIAEGFDADLVLLEDDGSVHATLVAGVPVHRGSTIDNR
ncbi:MAG: N-acetylglucosamine-6-phosphate deacetylase, partial [Gemmatimonadetes bacterium]|nr:N-acetylglucosamine-6-phosphate deacetylase [Gemmatimonadota bacterium]NIQ52741.1 N-acetylglucosamine-6-phosphate deacetylase [Gemmatimonadota bacterium]NIU72881.1 N-acetylglucosamine-6-phosphate deacetylase [Gammaproteobacteria bacterium]NIX43242.1 N-acetylglucosamine-6-phosphate deacetylase [Gemmatimonadota bacterium]NIY07416.1 N-acetylglucosamine-6-phosphate deacetylase [Gemmatimonadota bacterium]